MKLKICFLLCLCLNFRVWAQDINLNKSADPAVIKAGLNIGALVPDVPLKMIKVPGTRRTSVNSEPITDAAHLNAFKGKLLIIDFWATSCSSCIMAMPRLDSLQQQFADRLVILPVTAEKAERIKAYLRANRYLKGLDVTSVVEDQTLHALFPHRLLPHEVWISPAGKVLGFTDVKDVTAPSIRQALAGESFVTAEKVDVLDYDPAKPLLVGNNGAPDSAYRYRSLITAEIKGLPSAINIRHDTLRNLTVIRATNVSPRMLYFLAYQGMRSLHDNQVSMGNLRGLWCYELSIPGRSTLRVRQSVRQDLDRFFNVKSEWTGTAFRLIPVAEDPVGDEPLTL